MGETVFLMKNQVNHSIKRVGFRPTASADYESLQPNHVSHEV